MKKKNKRLRFVDWYRKWNSSKISARNWIRSPRVGFLIQTINLREILLLFHYENNPLSDISIGNLERINFSVQSSVWPSVYEYEIAIRKERAAGPRRARTSQWKRKIEEKSRRREIERSTIDTWNEKSRTRTTTRIYQLFATLVINELYMWI